MPHCTRSSALSTATVSRVALDVHPGGALLSRSQGYMFPAKCPTAKFSSASNISLRVFQPCLLPRIVTGVKAQAASHYYERDTKFQEPIMPSTLFQSRERCITRGTLFKAGSIVLYYVTLMWKKKKDKSARARGVPVQYAIVINSRR